MVGQVITFMISHFNFKYYTYGWDLQLIPVPFFFFVVLLAAASNS